MEAAFVRYKHRSLLFLDYCNGWFTCVYMLALVGRMMVAGNITATLMYLLYIIFKSLPYIPLLLGCKGFFLR
jgi:hypothetical protein